jgi:glycolate oxidase FAD binding subunit
VLLEISLKVLPRPATEITLAYEMDAERAIRQMNLWAGQPLPLSAAAHGGGTLSIRLSGAETGVRAARARLGGELMNNGETYWQALREHRQDFFQTRSPLWRLSVPPATPMLDLAGEWLIDWGGAQRWLISGAPDTDIRAAALSQGGYATPLSGIGGALQARASLPAPLRSLHAALKTAFDPAGIMNLA